MLKRVAADSDSAFFCSTVRTEDRAATAAVLCDLWPETVGFGDAVLTPDGLNAEDKAAKAEAL